MKKKLLHLTFLSLLLCACTTSGKEPKSNIPAEVQQVSDEIRNRFAPDKRVALFDADYRVSGKEILVKGVTTSREAKEELMSALAKLNYQVTDSLQVLPDEEQLSGKTYGIVNLSVCNLRATPDFSSEMVTQGLLGTPVKLLQHMGWYRIQTPDNYIAWVHRAGIHPVTKEEYNAWNSAGKVVVTSHYGFIYEKPDIKSQTVSDVVSGDRLKYEGAQGGFYQISYPDGREGYIPKTAARTEKEWRASLKQDPGSIVATARTLKGIPYLWAGTSAKGVDCSGFVRAVLYLHDIVMPRDASQQAYVGEHIDIAPDFGNLAPGDLLFFGRKATPERKERVVHVGIYTGDRNFIHSQGDVRINSFDPSRDNFDEFNLGRLLFATRIWDSLDKAPEINTTLTNPYYLPQ